MGAWSVFFAAVLALLAAVVVYDLSQRRHAILRNFPLVGHFRYWLEAVGPELRQYIVTGNDEERPFNRDQRRWVYSSAKLENTYFGYGTDADLERSPNYLIIKHAALAGAPPPPAAWARGDALPCAKILGERRGRARSFRPGSVVNVSGMSFGSLSGPAVQALNRGAALAGCLQSTGEGGLSVHHRCGGELIYQIGTGYFGCRDERGRFSRERLLETLASAPVRALEIKLSQGAKPGIGGLLPGAKVTPEIAAARGIPVGQDCVSPPRHSAFRDVDELLDFAESLSELGGGLPVGIKSAVGDGEFWVQLADAMSRGGRGLDFITIDGGEGGTGAGPLVFTDHVALPWKLAFTRVYRIFAERGLAHDVVFVGSAKLGFPESALLALGLGCDWVNVGREALLAIGCIQAQRCHTDHCPTGVATQNRWLIRGLDPTHKSVRLASYVRMLRHELARLAGACGETHPALVSLDRLELLDDRFGSRPLREVFEYAPGWGLPSAAQIGALRALAAAEPA